MQKPYLIISVVVTIVGMAFIVLPQSINIHLAPEQVILWEDSLQGTNYSFATGEYSIDDGVSPYVKVWSLEAVSLNTTFYLSGMGVTERFNITENPSEYLLPGEGTWSIEITGNIVEDTEETVYAGFYYLRPLEPERITYYPYKFFGYGMTAIGVMATLVIYARSTKKEELPAE
jgi:hypothetical protein